MIYKLWYVYFTYETVIIEFDDGIVVKRKVLQRLSDEAETFRDSHELIIRQIDLL